MDLCSTSKMHLPTIPLLLTLLPSTLATHSPPGPFPFSLPFNTTGTLTNLTLPTGPPPRLPAWHPWTPGPARGRGRPRRRPGRVFSPTLNNTLTPANTTLTTLPTMIPPPLSNTTASPPAPSPAPPPPASSPSPLPPPNPTPRYSRASNSLAPHATRNASYSSTSLPPTKRRCPRAVRPPPSPHTSVVVADSNSTNRHLHDLRPGAVHLPDCVLAAGESAGSASGTDGGGELWGEDVGGLGGEGVGVFDEADGV